MSKISYVLKNLIKYSSSLIAAFIVVNALSYFYCSSPQAVTNHIGFTCNKHIANKTAFSGQEGYGVNKVDFNGFNNLGDVTPDNAKVVCIGSSQTIAYGVDTEKNYVSVLNTLSASNRAYNLGVSGQFLYVSMARIPKVIENFRNADVIVIETPTFPSIEQFRKIERDLLEDRVDINDVDALYRNPIKSLLRTLPYDRLIHGKSEQLKQKTVQNVKTGNVFDDTQYRKLANACFSKLVAKSKGIKLILMYLSLPVLTKDGDCELKESDIILQQKAIIKNACEANGIMFLDMGQYFIEDFNHTKQPANGFLNSRIATGHINAYGYKIVARVLNERVKELRAKGAVR